jgi:transposase-like protein
VSLPTDDVLRKSVWLALQEIEKKWTAPVRNWGLIMNQFMLIFEDRIEI